MSGVRRANLVARREARDIAAITTYIYVVTSIYIYICIYFYISHLANFSQKTFLKFIELTTFSFMWPGSLLSVRVASLLDTSVNLGNYKYLKLLVGR